MIDEQELIEMIKDHKQKVCGDGFVYEAYGVAHDHIIDLIEMLEKKNIKKSEWISVEERLPKEFESVLGYMTDAGDFPAVRECYLVGRAFYFPSLTDARPVSHWMPFPEPPKGGE